MSDPVAGMVHRRMATLPARPFNQANAQVKQIALELDALFQEVEVVPAVDLPVLPPGTGPSDAAAAVRRALRIPLGPVRDLTGLEKIRARAAGQAHELEGPLTDIELAQEGKLPDEESEQPPDRESDDGTGRPGEGGEPAARAGAQESEVREAVGVDGSKPTGQKEKVT